MVMASPHMLSTFVHTCTTEVDIFVFSFVKFSAFATNAQGSKQEIGRAKPVHLGEALDHTSDKVTASIVGCLLQGFDVDPQYATG